MLYGSFKHSRGKLIASSSYTFLQGSGESCIHVAALDASILQILAKKIKTTMFHTLAVVFSQLRATPTYLNVILLTNALRTKQAVM